MQKHIQRQIKSVSHLLFNKNFFSIFHGSISARLSSSEFVINTKDAILDNLDENSLIELDLHNQDYRWSQASVDVELHEKIYELLPDAKYISYTMPPYTTAFCLNHDHLLFQDYYGLSHFGELTIYNPGKFDSWEERAPHEIANYFKTDPQHLLLIRGYGVIAYDRDITEMVKKISIVENSCRLLMLKS